MDFVISWTRTWLLIVIFLTLIRKPFDRRGRELDKFNPGTRAFSHHVLGPVIDLTEGYKQLL
jgi:hypothetical protein